MYTVWAEKTIPFSFPANRNFLYPFPSITEDSRSYNVSYTGIESVTLSLHSFSLTNLSYFLQNNGGDHSCVICRQIQIGCIFFKPTPSLEEEQPNSSRNNL